MKGDYYTEDCNFGSLNVSFKVLNSTSVLPMSWKENNIKVLFETRGGFPNLKNSLDTSYAKKKKEEAQNE